MTDIADIHAAISGLATRYANKQTALDFFYESDLQADLYIRLRTTFSTRGFNPQAECFPTPCVSDWEHAVINPIKSEYPLFKAREKSQMGRADIALVDRDHPNDQLIWRQPCRVAIELKLWQPTVGRGWIEGDYDRLSDYRHSRAPLPFLGVALLFVHPDMSATRKLQKWMDTLAQRFQPAGAMTSLPNDGVVLAKVDHGGLTLMSPV